MLEKLGDKGLAAELSLSERAAGSLANIAVLAPSGAQELDASAMQALVAAAPYPAPPASMLGPNQQALVTWKFVCRRK